MNYFLPLLILLFSTELMAASFETRTTGTTGLQITLSGTIHQGDELKFKKVLLDKGVGKYPIILRLNSRGGWANSAFRIADLVRQWGIRTVIYKHQNCFSACSFIFVAGWNGHKMMPDRVKYSSGKLGVHRPYDKFKGRIIDINKMGNPWLKRYFDFRKAGEEFYELTIKTHPKRVRLIRDHELLQMGAYKVVDKHGRMRIALPAEFVPMPVKKGVVRRVELTGTKANLKGKKLVWWQKSKGYRPNSLNIQHTRGQKGGLGKDNIESTRWIVIGLNDDAKDYCLALREFKNFGARHYLLISLSVKNSWGIHLSRNFGTLMPKGNNFSVDYYIAEKKIKNVPLKAPEGNTGIYNFVLPDNSSLHEAMDSADAANISLRIFSEIESKLIEFEIPALSHIVQRLKDCVSLKILEAASERQILMQR